MHIIVHIRTSCQTVQFSVEIHITPVDVHLSCCIIHQSEPLVWGAVQETDKVVVLCTTRLKHQIVIFLIKRSRTFIIQMHIIHVRVCTKTIYFSVELHVIVVEVLSTSPVAVEVDLIRIVNIQFLFKNHPLSLIRDEFVVDSRTRGALHGALNCALVCHAAGLPNRPWSAPRGFGPQTPLPPKSANK